MCVGVTGGLAGGAPLVPGRAGFDHHAVVLLQGRRRATVSSRCGSLVSVLFAFCFALAAQQADPGRTASLPQPQERTTEWTSIVLGIM